MPPLPMARSTSTAVRWSIGGSGDGPALTAPSVIRRARSVHGQMGADGFHLGAADQQVDHVHACPEPDDLTGSVRA